MGLASQNRLCSTLESQRSIMTPMEEGSRSMASWGATSRRAARMKDVTSATTIGWSTEAKDRRSVSTSLSHPGEAQTSAEWVRPSHKESELELSVSPLSTVSSLVPKSKVGKQLVVLVMASGWGRWVSSRSGAVELEEGTICMGS